MGGLAKVAIRQEIAAGVFFTNANAMIEFLIEKFAHHQSPWYNTKKLTASSLKLLEVQ